MKETEKRKKKKEKRCKGNGKKQKKEPSDSFVSRFMMLILYRLFYQLSSFLIIKTTNMWVLLEYWGDFKKYLGKVVFFVWIIKVHFASLGRDIIL